MLVFTAIFALLYAVVNHQRASTETSKIEPPESPLLRGADTLEKLIKAAGTMLVVVAALGWPALALQFKRHGIPADFLTKGEALRAGILPSISFAMILTYVYRTIKSEASYFKARSEVGSPSFMLITFVAGILFLMGLVALVAGPGVLVSVKLADYGGVLEDVESHDNLSIKGIHRHQSAICPDH